MINDLIPVITGLGGITLGVLAQRAFGNKRNIKLYELNERALWRSEIRDITAELYDEKPNYRQIKSKYKTRLNIKDNENAKKIMETLNLIINMEDDRAEELKQLAIEKENKKKASEERIEYIRPQTTEENAGGNSPVFGFLDSSNRNVHIQNINIQNTKAEVIKIQNINEDIDDDYLEKEEELQEYLEQYNHEKDKITDYVKYLLVADLESSKKEVEKTSSLEHLIKTIVVLGVSFLIQIVFYKQISEIILLERIRDSIGSDMIFYTGLTLFISFVIAIVWYAIAKMNKNREKMDLEDELKRTNEMEPKKTEVADEEFKEEGNTQRIRKIDEEDLD